jgi:hypothetical protein
MEAEAVEAVEEMGPVDFVVVEWPGQQPTGEAAPLLVDLVDRGLIRILDLVFVTKGEARHSAGPSRASRWDRTFRRLRSRRPRRQRRHQLLIRSSS